MSGQECVLDKGSPLPCSQNRWERGVPPGNYDSYVILRWKETEEFAVRLIFNGCGAQPYAVQTFVRRGKDHHLVWQESIPAFNQREALLTAKKLEAVNRMREVELDGLVQEN